jgi:hypothetical protein
LVEIEVKRCREKAPCDALSTCILGMSVC